MDMKQPYRIVIVGGISKAPSDPQMAWMIARLRELAKSACAVTGLKGDSLQVLVYPMAKTWEGKLPHWARVWPRVQGSTVELLTQVHVWCNNPAHVMMESLAVADEVWCLNAPGHGQLSNSPACKVWRCAQNTVAAARFKLVPSWVLSD